MTVANGFSQHNDIRHRALFLEREVMASEAPEPGLNLVGDQRQAVTRASLSLAPQKLTA